MISTSVCGQKSSSKLSKIKQPSDVDLYIKDAKRLKNENPSESLDNLKAALSLSIENKDIIGEAQCYLLIGEINQQIPEWDLAKENFKKAYIILQNNNEYPDLLRSSLIGLSNSYLNLHDHENALNYLQILSNIKSTTNDQLVTLLMMSEVYFQKEDYETSLTYAEKYEQIARNTNNIAKLTEIEQQKAKIYARTNKLDKAQYAYNQSVSRQQQYGDEIADPIKQEKAKEEIIKGLRGQNRYQEEVDLRTNTIQQNFNNKNLKQASKEKVELGELFIERGNTSSALKEMREAAAIADSIGDTRGQSFAYLSLAEAYSKLGNNQKSLESYKNYSIAAEKLITEKDSQQKSRSEIIKKQKSIEGFAKDITIDKQSFELRETEETLEKSLIMRQKLMIYGLLLIMFILIITSYYIYKNARASRLANQMLALKSLRSQMNPHFIFNALNSVNQFISQSDEKAANKFLSDFSKLMRQVLEHSQEDFISLAQEKETISLYLKLEHYRFRDKFDYTINIDETIDLDSVKIPPMLIQPYIENSVWHGLRYKNEKGELTLSIVNKTDFLIVTVADNGIGRKKSIELKTENQKKHNSKGLKNIQERLLILNKVYNTNYRVIVEDFDSLTGEGTKVSIYIPTNHDKA